MLFYIDLKESEVVKEFVKTAQYKRCNVTLKQDNAQVNGKSLVSIFSLDLSKSIQLIVQDGDYTIFDKFKYMAR